MCLRHFGDIVKQCDMFITLAIFWNNAMWFYHFGDPLKQCDDLYLSHWRRVIIGLNRQSNRNTSHCFKRSPKWWKQIALFRKIGKVLETCHIVVSKHRWSSRNTSHCFKILLAKFLNNATCFYHFGDVLKQCDAFLSLWRSFETTQRISITLAILWNNATLIYHFGNPLKQCDAYLSLWRSFETIRHVTITFAFLWSSATRFYHFGDVLYSNRTSSSRLERTLVD